MEELDPMNYILPSIKKLLGIPFDNKHLQQRKIQKNQLSEPFMKLNWNKKGKNYSLHSEAMDFYITW